MNTLDHQGDIDSLAAEYVLGTLDTETRNAVSAQRHHDLTLEQAITDWEHRLSPLALTGTSVEAPSELLAKILARIDAAQGNDANSNVIMLTRKMQRWRRIAMTTSALAASLLVIIGFQVSHPTQPDQFVAVLQQSDTSPAFLVSVDLKSRELTIRSVTAPAQQGKSYELWIVNDKLGAPRSLGVVDTQGVSVHRALARYDTSVVKDAVYAISLEPEGGSPTGHATGPVLYTGKLVELAM